MTWWQLFKTALYELLSSASVSCSKHPNQLSEQMKIHEQFPPKALSLNVLCFNRLQHFLSFVYRVNCLKTKRDFSLRSSCDHFHSEGLCYTLQAIFYTFINGSTSLHVSAVLFFSFLSYNHFSTRFSWRHHVKTHSTLNQDNDLIRDTNSGQH